MKALLFFCVLFLAWEAAPANLVRDGGLEQWEEIAPGCPGWDALSIAWKTWQFSRTDKGGVLRPAILNQPLSASYQGVLKLEADEAHEGKRSLRLKGEVYLNGGEGEDSYRTAEGDVYLVRYWVKGEGQTEMRLHVHGEGQAVILEKKGEPEKGKWTLIEERCLVVGQAPTLINPRIWTSEEMLVDDIFIGREPREKENSGKSVPEDCGERVVFANETSKPPVVDGKLDDECWRRTTAFSGFRGYLDQTVLAELQTRFRVLRDNDAFYFGMEIMLPDARQVLEKLSGQPLLDVKGMPRDKNGDVYTARHSIELFLRPPERPGYFQFVVSLDGYRYDGSDAGGAAWNGNWTSAIGAGEDRWFLELRAPARDLGLERITPGEEWGLNVVRNKETAYSTWSAVGGDFHNPSGFGRLQAIDFEQWRAAKAKDWESARKTLLDAADQGVDERLRRIDAYSAALGPVREDEAMDWEAVTRRYGGLAFIDWSYRVMREELCYRRLFQPHTEDHR